MIAIDRHLVTFVAKSQRSRRVIIYQCLPQQINAAILGYRHITMLIRTGTEYEIELPVTVTPLGAISRLEHALDDFEGERECYRQRLADAHRTLASYQSREDGDFAFSGELAEKRRELAEVEKALATDVEVSGASAIAA